MEVLYLVCGRRRPQLKRDSLGCAGIVMGNPEQNQFVDPEELPFTIDELYRASLTFLPHAPARRIADHLAEVAPGLIAERRERRAGWRQSGILNADELPLHAWVYPPELLKALASLSTELAGRVESLRAKLDIRPIWSRPGAGAA